MKSVKKIINSIYTWLLDKQFYCDLPGYMKKILAYYKREGMQFPNGEPNYLSNTVSFDGTDYSLISIGKGSTISREVLLLTHDGSLRTVYENVEGMLEEDFQKLRKWHRENNCVRIGKIVIGDNVFIGARVMILPETVIGDHSIIGAGAVIKGAIPPYSIVCGNPGKIIGDTRNYINKCICEKWQ